MSELETLIPFIWFAGIAFTGYVFFHKFSDVIKEKFRSNIKAHNANKKDKDIDDQMSSLIDNAPQMVQHIEAEISKQKEAGVTDDQMKGLISKKQILYFVIKNKEIIDIIGKPIIKKVLGVIKNI